MIVALYPDNSHEIRQCAYSCLRAKDLCLDRKLFCPGRLLIDRLASSPAEIAGRFNRHFGIRQCVSDGELAGSQPQLALARGKSKVNGHRSSLQWNIISKIPY